MVESLARLTWITRFAPGYLTARAMAAQMAVDWLGWLNTAWPDLTGEVRGMPTDFPDPRISAPTAWYEEPHSPAVVLRACIWLKLAGFGNATTLDAIMLRCWEYLESLWVTAGPMRYTWSANPDDGEWFGFWHFEIVTTISVMLDEAPACGHQRSPRQYCASGCASRPNGFKTQGLNDGVETQEQRGQQPGRITGCWRHDGQRAGWSRRKVPRAGGGPNRTAGR